MNKKKMETSKKIILASYIISIALTIAIILGSFWGYDTGNITTIACLSFAEVSASNIWYFKKASRENVVKIVSSLENNLKEQVDINQLLNQ